MKMVTIRNKQIWILFALIFILFSSGCHLHQKTIRGNLNGNKYKIFTREPQEGSYLTVLQGSNKRELNYEGMIDGMAVGQNTDSLALLIKTGRLGYEDRENTIHIIDLGRFVTTKSWKVLLHKCRTPPNPTHWHIDEDMYFNSDATLLAIFYTLDATYCNDKAKLNTWDQMMSIYDTASGNLIAQILVPQPDSIITNPYWSYTAFMGPVQITFSPDNKYVTLVGSYCADSYLTQKPRNPYFCKNFAGALLTLRISDGQLIETKNRLNNSELRQIKRQLKEGVTGY